MPRTKLKLTLGLTRVRKPLYPSEAGFVASVNEQVQVLTKELLSIFQQVEDVSPEVMIDALEPTFQKSQEYCPKDTHELVDSGYLEDVSTKGRPMVEMGYAKGGVPRYAPYVHEILEYHHQAPTQAKFLERPMMEDLDQIKDRLEQGYNEFISSGKGASE